MKKFLLSTIILLSIVLLVSTATAIPYTYSKTIENKKITYQYIKENRYTSISNPMGLIYILIGLFGIAETALLAILAYVAAAHFHFSELGIVLLILAVITGIPSVAFLVAGTVLIFQ
jgi:hypothetical protein